MNKIVFSQLGYDQKCGIIEKYILQAYSFFMWYGSTIKNRRDELRSIIMLEGLLLQLLLNIKDLYEMRGKGLYNESTNMFKELLSILNDQMHRGTSYIRSSNKCLESDLAIKDSCSTAMRQDVVDGFRAMAGWLKEETQKPQNKVRAKELIDELGLNYQKRLFGCMGDNFEQHANMVMNGLMLLAIPSHADASNEDYAELYKNSYETFRNSTRCKEEMEALASKIEDEYNTNDIVTHEKKIAYLKKLWGATKTDIRNALGKVGINYTNTNNDTHVGKMGHRLYEALNMDSDEDGVKMSNEDLCRFFQKEAQLAFIASMIEHLKETTEDPTPGKDFFAEGVKRKELRLALYKTIYEEQGLNKNGEKRYVLGAQGHWLAVLKVMQTYDMVRGSMSDFAELMKLWYPVAPHPCDYRCMISVRAFEVKTKPYPDWSRLDKANFAYLRVAETFVKYLREYHLVE